MDKFKHKIIYKVIIYTNVIYNKLKYWLWITVIKNTLILMSTTIDKKKVHNIIIGIIQ